MKKASWKAVRKGRTYCSPACGLKCTYGEYRCAKSDADKLAKKLGGKWKPRVWENLGWHYDAVCGASNVFPTASGYWAHIEVGSQFTSHHRNPLKAVENAIKEADKSMSIAVKARKALNL